MSRRIHPDDAGMQAVKRVRGVREQASRIGLQQALAEERAAAAQLETYRAQLAEATTFTGRTRTDFVEWRHHLTRLGEAIEASQQAVATAATITADAKAHWLHDKARLKAVEHLLAHRAAARAAAAAKAEAMMLDDIAAQLWQRRQRAAAANTGDLVDAATLPGGQR